MSSPKTSTAPRLSKLLDFWKPRASQLEAFDFVTKSFEMGKKFCMADLPVGTGKSLFAMMVAKWYREKINPNGKIDIITNSVILQEQYMKDFPFLAKVYGKARYECHNYNTDCEKGSKINALKNKKSTCEDCPWREAMDHFCTKSEVSMCNFHIYSTWHLFIPKMITELRQPNLLIIDEAHELENVFSDFISASITRNDIEKLGFDERKTKSEIRKLETEISDLEDLHALLVRYLAVAKTREGKLDSKYSNMMDNNASDSELKRVSREMDSITSLLRKWTFFVNEYNKADSNWAFEKSQNVSPVEKKTTIELHAKPIWAFDYLDRVWNRYDHVIFMSGTILDYEIFSKLYGFEMDYATYISQKMPFDVNKRPIYYTNKLGKMTFKEKHTTIKKMLTAIEDILEDYKEHKGIIHTGNYENAEKIKMHIKNDRLLCYNTNNRDEMLKLHYESKEPTVLVGPSMMSGVDLKGDASRFQIIMKIPYPNLKSDKIKKRLEDKNINWYSWITAGQLIQAYGRSIRDAEDWADTYILDASFANILNYNSDLLPDYFKDALKYI